MAKQNPRSKLRRMKMQYFFTTAALFTVIFIVLHFFSTVLFMIYEVSPYARLAVFFSIVALDYFLVNYIVNVKLSSRWKREAPDLMDVIQVPEPEYVIDEVTAKQLEMEKALTASAEKQAGRKGVIAKLMRALAPVDDSSTEADTKPDETAKKPVPSPKPQPRHAAKYETSQVPSSAADNETHPSSGSNGWQKRLDEMETAKLSEVLPVLEQHQVETEAVPAKDETAVPKVPEQPESIKKKSSGSRLPRRKKEKTDNQPSQHAKKQVNERKRRKAGRKEDLKTPTDESAESLSVSASSWSVPFEEMETEELEAAVEKAMDGGYNPTSNERNK